MPFKFHWYRNKLAKWHSKGMRGYPVATVNFYGPNDMHASKVALGIIADEGMHTDVVERWFSNNGDVRKDPEIAKAIMGLMVKHGVKSVVLGGHIVGCPHEEGIDYPLGEACPKCMFWTIRERWSDELTH